MKKHFILHLLLTLVWLLSCFLVSCEKKQEARGSDINSTDSLVQSLLSGFEEPNDFYRLSDDDIFLTLGIPSDCYEKAYVYVNTSGAVIDEFGIFEVDKDKTELLSQKLSLYIEDSKLGKRDWLLSYNPPEADKLENGRLLIFEDKIIYGFLEKDVMKNFERLAKSCYDY